MVSLPEDKPSIATEYRPHVQLYYRVLSHLDLGDDAADLCRYGDVEPERTDELASAYRAAPGRLILQAAPLLADDLEETLELLRGGRLHDDHDADRRLANLVAEILETEASRRSLPSHVPREVDWLERLDDCRRHLWSRLDGPCPPLRIFDVPALADGTWTNGRGTSTGDERVVSVSLHAGPNAFVQVLHEEIHPVTDPVIRAQSGAARRDTRVGSHGYELHRQLERMAVEVGEALIETRAPGYADAYDRWRRRFL